MKTSIPITSLIIFIIFNPIIFSKACSIKVDKIESLSSDNTLSKKSINPSYEWVRSIAPGNGCFPENCSKGQFPLAIIPLIAFDEKLWMISQKSIWSSVDGINWISQPKTDWGERSGMAYVFFDNKLWMMGGMKTWGDFRNDVWCSSDGKEWKQVTTNAGWYPRRGHSVVVFDNKMWISGGALSSGRDNQTPTHFLNDIWSSSDGIHWTRVTNHAPWSERDSHISLVFNNLLWVFGGAEKNDVWYSDDGSKWTLATPNAEWSKRLNNGGLVFDGKLWIFGGRGMNDVWNSVDGKLWQRVFTNAPWSTRTAIHSVVYNNKLFVYSGKTGREDSWAGDVWTMKVKLNSGKH